MHRGSVVSWYSRKGYGFIKCRDFDDDLFVHVSGFGGGELIEGKDVTFDVQDDPSGKKRCVNVTGPGVDSERQPRRRDSGDRDRDRRDSRRDDSRDRGDRRRSERETRDRGSDRRRDDRDDRDRKPADRRDRR